MRLVKNQTFLSLDFWANFENYIYVNNPQALEKHIVELISHIFIVIMSMGS